MSHPDVFMTLTCHHFCPLTLENSLQAITGRIPPAGTHICHYTPSWVMSESCGFHGFHHLPLKPLQANCCLKTQKKTTKNQKIPQCQYPSKWLESPNFWHLWHFWPGRRQKKVAALRARTAGSLIWWRLRPQSAPPGQSMPQY